MSLDKQECTKHEREKVSRAAHNTQKRRYKNGGGWQKHKVHMPGFSEHPDKLPRAQDKYSSEPAYPER
jgi:hypothetical protein